MLEQLYLGLILIGGTIFVVMGSLLRQTRNHASKVRALIFMNERLNFDLPDLLRESWPILASGGFLGIHWELDWFGTHIEGNEGVITAQHTTHESSAQGMSISVKIYLPKNRWERRYFGQMLAENFFLLLRMNMWIKLGSINTTFEQSARMTVFLQHDIKNLLQLISLTADQLELDMPDRAARLLPVFERSIPALRDRVNLILARLASGGSREDARDTDLAAFIKAAAAVHELSVDITGSAQVHIANDALHSVIDNLLGNYRQIAVSTGINPMLDIQITAQKDQIICSLLDTNGKPFSRPERLFEPFWSENSRGRGVGLYQAREVCKSWGGSLDVSSDSNKPLKFILVLPKVSDLSPNCPV
jgi:signal transduction histidine kinase